MAPMTTTTDPRNPLVGEIYTPDPNAVRVADVMGVMTTWRVFYTPYDKWVITAISGPGTADIDGGTVAHVVPGTDPTGFAVAMAYVSCAAVVETAAEMDTSTVAAANHLYGAVRARVADVRETD